MGELGYNYTIQRTSARFLSEENLNAISRFIELEEESNHDGNLVCGMNGNKIRIFDSNEIHNLILGDTGSGKTRRELLPYMFSTVSAEESFIVNDTKGDLITYILPYVQKKSYKIVILDFKNLKSVDTWNPLFYATELYHAGKKTEAMKMIKNLYISIFGSLKAEKDPYWENAAISVCTGATEFLLENAEPEYVTLQNVMVVIQDLGKKMQSYLIEETPVGEVVKNGEVRKLIFNNSKLRATPMYQRLSILYDNAKDTGNCVLSLIRTGLENFYAYDDVIRFVGTSSFNIEEFGTTPTAVFLLTSDTQKDMDPLVANFFEQAYMANVMVADRIRGRRLPFSLHFIIDEFNSLTPINDISKKISTSRSRGIRFTLVVQSYAALRSVYGDDIAKNIIINCGAWCIMRSSEYEVHRLVQERLGEVVLPSGKKDWLITIAQLNRLKLGEAIIVYKGEACFTELPDISEYKIPIKPLELYEGEEFFHELPKVFNTISCTHKIIAMREGKTVEEMKKEAEKIKENKNSRLPFPMLDDL